MASAAKLQTSVPVGLEPVVNLGLETAASVNVKPGLVVNTAQGLLVGDTTEAGCHRFLGIPFAQPPVGEFRWAAPRPPTSWEGIRDATKFGNGSIQALPGGIPDTGAFPGFVDSEDCLFLNVWTKTVDPNAKQAVMFWIHGGGFFTGSSSFELYTGQHLAEQNVTIVSINYRLEALGFLVHPELGGNFAVQDWVAGLQWVSKNIQNFGGDPDNVTIFGESAGGIAVRTLLSTPSAKGLFHRAISQSPTFDDMKADPIPSFKRTQKSSKAFFEAIGTSDIEKLRALPVGEISVAATKAAHAPPEPGLAITPADLPWHPVPDGKIVSTEYEGWAEGVPLLFGYNADEARCFYNNTITFGQATLSPEKFYTEATALVVAKSLCGNEGEEVYRYFDNSALTAYEKICQIVTLGMFGEAGQSMYNERADDASRPGYYYRFNRVSPGARRSNLLAVHTGELPYLFGPMTRTKKWAPWGLVPSPDPVPHPDYDYDETDVELSRLIQEAWVSFARTGVPRNGDFEWPACSAANPQYTVIDETIEGKPLVVHPIEALLADRRKR